MKKFILAILCILLCIGVFLSVSAKADSNNSNIDVSIDITYHEVGDDIYVMGIIKTYQNGSFLWEYATDLICATGRDLEDSWQISDVYTDNHGVYFVADCKLYALDILSGHLKWTVDDVGELNCITSDDYGNVYIGNYYNVAKYKFIVADKNGNILHRENNDEYHSDILNLEIEDNKLKISYVTNEIKEFDISSFKPVDAKVVLNGDTVKFDQPPVVIDGRTLVPVRAVIEAMDGQVGWDEATQTATLSLNGNVIKLIIGNTNAYLNDETKTLDVAPQVINDRTLLPIRFVAEGFGFNVDWNEDTSSVIINGDVSQIVNKELLNCIGKTKREIVDMYGRIVDSEYIIGGKYYIHERMKTEMFYENDDNAYDYNIHDDANENSTCLSLIAKLDELIKVQDKIYYSIDDLQSVFGKYEFENYLDDENFPSCYYRFEYGDYSLSIESDRLNPKVQYISVYKENQ